MPEAMPDSVLARYRNDGTSAAIHRARELAELHGPELSSGVHSQITTWAGLSVLARIWLERAAAEDNLLMAREASKLMTEARNALVSANVLAAAEAELRRAARQARPLLAAIDAVGEAQEEEAPPIEPEPVVVDEPARAEVVDPSELCSFVAHPVAADARFSQPEPRRPRVDPPGTKRQGGGVSSKAQAPPPLTHPEHPPDLPPSQTPPTSREPPPEYEPDPEDARDPLLAGMREAVTSFGRKGGLGKGRPRTQLNTVRQNRMKARYR